MAAKTFDAATDREACRYVAVLNGANYAAALKAEMRRVERNYQQYTCEQRANHAASHRLGHRQRVSPGRFFYTHPDVPGLAFSTRKAAAEAALDGAASCAG